ncbi:hypothetical protein L3V86_08145 [Thiotrichales bacterium 19S11-10]|nr:hypothetical protein [Thiotrichales bacterium 19S11-10]
MIEVTKKELKELNEIRGLFAQAGLNKESGAGLSLFEQGKKRFNNFNFHHFNQEQLWTAYAQQRTKEVFKKYETNFSNYEDARKDYFLFIVKCAEIFNDRVLIEKIKKDHGVSKSDPFACLYTQWAKPTLGERSLQTVKLNFEKSLEGNNKNLFNGAKETLNNITSGIKDKSLRKSLYSNVFLAALKYGDVELSEKSIDKIDDDFVLKFRDKDGNTVLHYLVLAANNADEKSQNFLCKIIQKLREKGADFNLGNYGNGFFDGGKTPKGMAHQDVLEKIIELELQYKLNKMTVSQNSSSYKHEEEPSFYWLETQLNDPEFQAFGNRLDDRSL